MPDRFRSHAGGIVGRLCHLAWVYFVCLSFIAGCTREPSLQEGDTSALANINKNSGWSLHTSSTRLELGRDGVVELIFTGTASQKLEEKKALWIPLVLLETLPSYYRLDSESPAGRAELEAYQLTSGTWCITAVLFDESSGSSDDMSIPERESRIRDVRVRVTLFSPEYARRLPLVVLSGRQASAVDFSIHLPADFEFTGTSVLERGSTRDEDFRLAVLPPSLGGAATAAGATLRARSSGAWDLSLVAYSPSRGSIWLSPPFQLGIGLVFCLLIGVSVMRLRANLPGIFHPASQWRVDTPSAYRELWASVLFTIGANIRILDDVLRWLRAQEQSEIMDPRLVNDAVRTLERSQAELKSLETMMMRAKHIATPRVIYMAVHRQAAFIHRILLRSQKQHPSLIDEALSTLNDLDRQVEQLKHISLDGELFDRRRRFLMKRLTWFAIAVAIFVGLIMIVTSSAQGDDSSHQQLPDDNIVLGDLTMAVAPSYGPNGILDHTEIMLDFAGLTDLATSRRGEVAIALDRTGSARFAEVTRHDQAAITNNNGLSLLLDVPLTSWSSLTRWKSLAGQVRGLDAKSYRRALDRATRVTIGLKVIGATDTSLTRNGWFHWFPFDTQFIALPTQFRQPALVSAIDFSVPTSGFVVTPAVDGISSLSHPSKNGRLVKFVPVDESNPVWPGATLTVKANLVRTSFQRYSLSVGLVIVSIIVGLALGWLTTLPEKSWQAMAIGSIGVLGLPYTIHSAVFGVYDALPTLTTGQGVTLFETLFIVDVFVLLFVCALTRKRLARPKVSPLDAASALLDKRLKNRR